MRNKLPMRHGGADGLVVAMNSGNAEGAKGPDSLADGRGQPFREEPMPKAKPYEIPKQLVMHAYKRVKRNRVHYGSILTAA